MGTLRHRLVLCCVALCGCGRDSNTTHLESSSHVPPERTEVSALEPGPRPKTIRDAEVCDLHAFHQNPGSKGRWVCLGGIVTWKGTTMGGPSLRLKCPDCDESIYAEGDNLDKYRIWPDTKIMIRGHLFSSGGISAVEIVTQPMIEDALKEEQRKTGT